MEQIELKEFVQKVIADIEAGIEIEKRDLNGPIKFEISVSRTEKMDGNLKIFVASGGSSVEKGSVAKISFEVYPYDQKKVERWNKRIPYNYKVPV
ncbi:MAG: hypothetical protein Q6354_01145 [Candidatus Brocadiales bacterium]|nr:hypothetical protein [Candidatus Brocadiales bacterium]